jgi:hypothetical protein
VSARPGLVPRILSGVLIFQFGIGALLVLGDVQSGGGFRMPSFAPDAPPLTEPVRPGDQRRVFRPDRDHPQVQPLRDPGILPDRLMLTREDGAIWRLEGGIEGGDAVRIVKQLAEAAPERVILQSPGGSVGDALQIGRAIRDAGIETQILAGEYCMSACPYMLAGGTARDISPDGAVGVHQHFFGENVLLPAAFAVEDIQRGQAEVMGYLDEMGIDPLVMRLAMTTPPDEIYVLLPEELERYGFVTAPE